MFARWADVLSSFSNVFFGVFGICFLCNCIVVVSFPSPSLMEVFGSVDPCVGMEKPGSATGREQVLEPLSASQLLNSSQPGGFWGLCSVSLSC